MRQVILDTETTGLDPTLGHRVIEIGAVELVNRRVTERRFHHYVNPERESESGALEVHGLTAEFLRDKPRFRDIAAELLDFIRDAEVVIHNAPFDIAFLNMELGMAELGSVESCCASITDTLRLAKDLSPGKRNGLDALCERYQVDNSARTLHGALLDASLLADVYLAMTRGQDSLAMDLQDTTSWQQGFQIGGEQLQLIVLEASEEEIAAHLSLLDEIDAASNRSCVWKHLEVDALRCG